MKRILYTLMALCLVCVCVTGCSAKTETQPKNNDLTTQELPSPSPSVKGIDVDLTVLSSTMVYAEVYNIMDNPTEYMGKTIKMNGPYSASYSGDTGLYYHYVIIEDATACCQQGLEFLWSGDHNYPDDYPEDNTKIEVVGTFGSYEELGRTYYYLAVDDVSVL